MIGHIMVGSGLLLQENQDLYTSLIKLFTKFVNSEILFNFNIGRKEFGSTEKFTKHSGDLNRKLAEIVQKLNQNPTANGDLLKLQGLFEKKDGKYYLKAESVFEKLKNGKYTLKQGFVEDLFSCISDIKKIEVGYMASPKSRSSKEGKDLLTTLVLDSKVPEYKKRIEELEKKLKFYEGAYKNLMKEFKKSNGKEGNIKLDLKYGLTKSQNKNPENEIPPEKKEKTRIKKIETPTSFIEYQFESLHEHIYREILIKNEPKSGKLKKSFKFHVADFGELNEFGLQLKTLYDGGSVRGLKQYKKLIYASLVEGSSTKGEVVLTGEGREIFRDYLTENNFISLNT